MKKKDKCYEEVKHNYEFYGRFNFYNTLVTSLRESEGHLSVAINGVWGSGKTIFSLKLVDEFQKYNDICGIYFNAWENDYFETPIYAIINLLLSDIEFCKVFESSIEANPQIKLNLGLSIGGISIRPNIDNKYEEVLKSIKYNSFVLSFARDLLNNYLKSKNKRFIFVIDELDRCKPEFALFLLEQLKNINVEGLVFLYFIDIEQLGNSIKSNYSSSYNVSNYLYKFFDEILTLPDLDTDNFFTYFERVCPIVRKFQIRKSIIYDAALTFRFSYRDINRIDSYLKSISQFDIKSRTISQYYIVLVETTLVLFCMLRVKFPYIFRDVLWSMNLTEDLNAKLRLNKSYMNLFNEVISMEPKIENSEFSDFILDLLNNEYISKTLS